MACAVITLRRWRSRDYPRLGRCGNTRGSLARFEKGAAGKPRPLKSNADLCFTPLCDRQFGYVPPGGQGSEGPLKVPLFEKPPPAPNEVT